MVVKTLGPTTHTHDLAEIFNQLGKYNMRLNTTKCAFGVRGGKFLGFMLTQHGIEANHDKCQSVLQMRSSAMVSEVQQLTGRTVALSHFYPRWHKSLYLWGCYSEKEKTSNGQLNVKPLSRN